MEELFDRAEEYDDMLNQGLKLSGEGKEFFMHGRLALMQKHLPKDLIPSKILDFGCGIGDTTEQIALLYPEAQVTGIDTATEAIAYAERNKSSERLRFSTISSFTDSGSFDLAYVNGVFHHIPLEFRSESAGIVHRALRKGGFFAFFENNPWNPGTMMVMSRIPFDRDAITLSYLEARGLLSGVGFSILRSRFAFYFPAALSFMRPIEPALEALPLGAQYLVLAQKP